MNDAPPSPAPARVAVVLGSSFLGVHTHSGFLNGLHAAGLEPTRIAGASAGALAGAFHAIGLRGDRLRDAALSRKLHFSYADLGALGRLPGVLTSFWASGIFSGKRAIAYLRSVLGDRDLAGLPLDIAVTDVATARAEILRSGPLAESVMASCAVPALFTIQQVGDRRFLDGGIGAELPFEHLIDDPGIDLILLHRIRHETGSGPTVNWETVATAVGTAHHTACNELHRLRAERARAAGKRLVEIDTLTPFPGLLSSRRAPLCHDRGFASGKDAALQLGFSPAR